jgi:hypothetical protein
MATAVVDSSDESHSDVPSEVPSEDGESDGGGGGGGDNRGKEIVPSRPVVRRKERENVVCCLEYVCMSVCMFECIAVITPM